MITERKRNMNESQRYNGCHWTTNLDLGDEVQARILSVLSCHNNPMQQNLSDIQQRTLFLLVCLWVGWIGPLSELGWWRGRSPDSGIC